jgi:osmotically-inducible protein OsmY
MAQDRHDIRDEYEREWSGNPDDRQCWDNPEHHAPVRGRPYVPSPENDPNFQRRFRQQGLDPYNRRGEADVGQSDSTGWGNEGNAGREGYYQGFEGRQQARYQGRPQEWGDRQPRSNWDNEAEYGTELNWPLRMIGQGTHAGKGPKGWKRSDERIAEEVNQRLTDHPYVDPSGIEVAVQDGEVTLTGVVDERRAKRLAEDIAASVSGVRDVHNRLRLQEAAVRPL